MKDTDPNQALAFRTVREAIRQRLRLFLTIATGPVERFGSRSPRAPR